MRQTRIVLFPPARGTTRAQSPDEVKKRLGADVVAVDEKTFDDHITGADEKAVRAEAARWTEGAKAIIEPNQEDITKAARISVALQNLMQREQSQGLAIGTCMGWLPKGFPCLGFTRLRDAGIPAACEGDMDSLLTMLLYQHAIDRPGFQGNATFDTSRNAVWTAHCTAPLKMDGPDGKAAPYRLRSIMERQEGCVPQVFMRRGQKVTQAWLATPEKLLYYTGDILAVPDSERGCRTQIKVRVDGEIAKVWQNWGHGLHRLTAYGDLTADLQRFCRYKDVALVNEA
jgi:L-fucose isomerase-like protein